MTLFRPATTHADLGEGFFDAVRAAEFPKTILRYRNQRWAGRIGLDGLDEARWTRHFGRFEPLPGSFPQPLALRYHGHQFRVYNPDIGDGRGFLFAQMLDDQDRLLDLATKGSGRTPYSRTADGRLTLKGGIREVLATAMLEAQGVYTSKSFSLIETGEDLMRGDEPSPTRSSVLVRLSHSHIRIGTFERLLAENDGERIGTLVRHCVEHYPDGGAPSSGPAGHLLPQGEKDSAGALLPLREKVAEGRMRATPTPDTALAFFKTVVARVARLGAQWMAAGFVHGVLNTDNINITGESFDYGPYRWLPVFEPGFTAAYFDQFGLYAYGRQPGALKWNLARLAECLTLMTPLEGLEAALERFDETFNTAMREAVLWRLGLGPLDPAADDELVSALFTFLRESQAPFDQVFFDCAGGEARLAKLRSGPLAEFTLLPSFDRLASALKDRALRAGIDLDHPYFARTGPESMLHDAIEQLWAPIAASDDWSLFEAKLAGIEAMRMAYGG